MINFSYYFCNYLRFNHYYYQSLLLTLKSTLGKGGLFPITKTENRIELLDDATLEKINAIYNNDPPFPPETYAHLKRTIHKGWMTRLYFSRGKHNLVLPAWLLGLLGPTGTARRGIAGLPILMNTDLHSYYALGSPNSEEEPVIDHKGGIIPTTGSYTLMFGTIVNERAYYSSEIGDIDVKLHEAGYPIASVKWEVEGDVMLFNVFADRKDGNEVLVINVVRGFSNHQLLITLCPMDQEGVTEVDVIEYNNKDHLVKIKNKPDIMLSEPPIHALVSDLHNGHAGRLISSSKNQGLRSDCKAKASSWAASFPVRASPDFLLPLTPETKIENFSDAPDMDDIEYDWEDIADGLPKIDTSNEKVNYFFKVSALVLRLLSDKERNSITMGPSLQEEMWIPSLPFQVRALDRLGFSDSIVRKVLENVLGTIDNNGIVTEKMQWDAQGAIVQAVMWHYFYTQDKDWLGANFSVIKRIGEWVNRQSKREDENPLVNKLLPPGAPSWYNALYWELDYYYFNNFWAAGVLKYLSILAKELGKHGDSEKFKNDLDHFHEEMDASISQIVEITGFLPAGPFKRDSAEMIFNLHAFYPLQHYGITYQPLLNTYKHLWENYVKDGGLLIDQPWNSYGTYLSILMAQTARYLEDDEKVEEVINFMITHATNSQGWAEGISPLTGMGSVGDSPNGYAAAEFVNLILDMFVEEYWDNSLLILKGIPISWLESGIKADGINLFGKGKLKLEAIIENGVLNISWEIISELEELSPKIYLSKIPREIPKELRQISNHVYQLPGLTGSLKVKID